MAMDSMSWAVQRRGRQTDGVACDARASRALPRLLPVYGTWILGQAKVGHTVLLTSAAVAAAFGVPAPITTAGPPSGADVVETGSPRGTNGSIAMAAPLTTPASDPTKASTPLFPAAQSANPVAPSPDVTTHLVCRG
jgi:hypothetical protein